MRGVHRIKLMPPDFWLIAWAIRKKEHRSESCPMVRGLALLTFVLLGIGALFLVPSKSAAEDGCPPGLAPIGQAPGPICVPMPGYGLSPPPARPHVPPPPPIVLPDLHTIYATDVNESFLTFESQQPDRVTGERALVAACAEEARRPCKSYYVSWNNCSAATQELGKPGFFIVSNRTWDGAAAAAMKACNRQQSVGKCVFPVMPVCSGRQYSAEETGARASRATTADLDALTRKHAAIGPWGAIASDGSSIGSGINMPIRPIAEAEARRSCTGDCRIMATYQNSCVGIAWPTDDRPFIETAVDPDPKKAEEAALAQCSGKYGSCKSSRRCSGKRYGGRIQG